MHGPLRARLPVGWAVKANRLTDDQFAILLLRHRYELRMLAWLRAGIEADRLIKENRK